MLSEVSCRIDLPSVHIPSERSREWKTLSGMREVQVGCRTSLINSVRGWLRGQGLLAGILFALWKDGTTYDPARLTR